jgi:hypothetical protein
VTRGGGAEPLVAALRSAAGLMVARIGAGGEELTRTMLMVR